MKYLLSKCGNFGKEFQWCLCEWHNLTAASFSPAQLFFGRKLCTALPALDKQYKLPSHFPSKIKEKQQDIKVKAQFDQQRMPKLCHLSRWDKKCVSRSRCLRNGILLAQLPIKGIVVNPTRCFFLMDMSNCTMGTSSSQRMCLGLCNQKRKWHQTCHHVLYATALGL